MTLHPLGGGALWGERRCKACGRSLGRRAHKCRTCGAFTVPRHHRKAALAALTSAELLRLIDRSDVAATIRAEAIEEWQGREEQKARDAAVATWMLDMEGRR